MGTVVVTGVTGKLGKEVMKALPKAVPFYREDFDNPEPKLKNADVIIHIAGCMHGSHSDLVTGNCRTTARLLNYAPHKLKRFIYVSTAAEGGDYVKTKRQAEEFIIHDVFDYVILRPTIIIFDKDNRLLNRFFKLVKRYPIIPLPGGGTNMVQPIYYKDVVQSIINSTKCRKNKIINLVGRDMLSFKDIINKVSVRLNKQRLILSLPRFFIYLNPLLTWEERNRFFDDKTFCDWDMENILKVRRTSFDDMLKEVEI